MDMTSCYRSMPYLNQKIKFEIPTYFLVANLSATS